MGDDIHAKMSFTLIAAFSLVVKTKTEEWEENLYGLHVPFSGISWLSADG